MLSIVTRIRSRITSSSAPFPGPPLLLSLSMASSSGTRRQTGASCGSTRRILTPFLLFYQLRDTTLKEPPGSLAVGDHLGSDFSKLQRVGQRHDLRAKTLAEA